MLTVFIECKMEARRTPAKPNNEMLAIVFNNSTLSMWHSDPTCAFVIDLSQSVCLSVCVFVCLSVGLFQAV